MSAATAALKTQNPAKAEKTSPLTADEFLLNATAVELMINGVPFTFNVKTPTPGKNLGWFGNGKVTLKINGKLCPCSFSANLTIDHSKQPE